MPVICGIRWSATISGCRLAAQGQPGQHFQRLGPRRRAHDAVAGGVAAAQVPSDRGRNIWIVVDRQDGRLAHEISLRAASPPAERRGRRDGRTVQGNYICAVHDLGQTANAAALLSPRSDRVVQMGHSR
jgi:hypothetical protein